MMPQLLREARNDAARSVHVATVLLSEPIEHHPLLARHPQTVQGRKHHQTRPASGSVLQQQSLRYAPQPLGGVHLGCLTCRYTPSVTSSCPSRS